MDEIRKVLQLSLGDSPKNVRELKSDIYELKNAIGDMVVAGKTGTTEYDQAVKLLGQDLQTLQQVQNSTKKEVDALDGSYNALVQRMRELKTEWRATNDEAKRNELGQQIVQINDQLKALDYGLGNFQRNVGNYGNAMQSLGQTVNTVQQAGSQFTNGLIAMGGALNLTQAETESYNASLSTMQKTFAIMNSARGLLGFINAIKAKTAATKAAKAEEMAATVATKAQTVATNAQTTATVTATVAQEALNTAVKKNPIGAIVAVIMTVVAALGALATALIKAHSAMKKYESQTDSLKKAEEQLNEKLEESNTHYNNKVKIWKALGIEGRKLINLQRDELKTQLAMAKAHLATAEAAEAEFLAELRLETRGAIWIATHQGMIKQMKIFEERTNAARKTVDDLDIAIKNLTYDALAEDIKDANDAMKKGTEAAKKHKEQLEKTAEEGQKEIEEIEKAGYNARQKAYAEYKEKLHKLVQGRDAEVDIAKAAGLPTKDIFDKYNAAALKLYDQYLKQLDGVYKDELKQYMSKEEEKNKWFSKSWLQRTNAYNRAIKEMGLDYEGVFGKMFSLEEANVAETRLNSMRRALQGFLNTFKDALGNGLEKTDLNDLLEEFDLFGSSFFESKYGEPLTAAIKDYFDIMEQESLTGYKQYAEVVEMQTGVIWDQILKGNIEQAKKTIDGLYGFIIGQSVNTVDEKLIPAVREQAKKFADNLKSQFYLEMAQDPLIKKEDALNFLDQWYELAKNNTPAEGIDRLTQSYQRLMAEIKYNSLEKNLIKPLDAVANLLNNVASAWENTIRAQVDAGKKSEEEAKAEFERMKALQYAVAVISTASAVIQALADPTIPSYIVKGINAAAALAAGIAQIAQISATHYGSSGSASTSMPSLVDRSPVTPTVSLNASEAGESMQQNMRVYVVESDITEAQDAARVRVSESTF